MKRGASVARALDVPDGDRNPDFAMKFPRQLKHFLPLVLVQASVSAAGLASDSGSVTLESRLISRRHRGTPCRKPPTLPEHKTCQGQEGSPWSQAKGAAG